MDQLNKSNLMLYAARHYYNPRFSDIEEFNESWFKYVKRLLNRYLDEGNLSELDTKPLDSYL